MAAADSFAEVGWEVCKVAEQVVDGPAACSSVAAIVVVVAAAAVKAAEQVAVV